LFQTPLYIFYSVEIDACKCRSVKVSLPFPSKQLHRAAFVKTLACFFASVQLHFAKKVSIVIYHLHKEKSGNI